MPFIFGSSPDRADAAAVDRPAGGVAGRTAAATAVVVAAFLVGVPIGRESPGLWAAAVVLLGVLTLTAAAVRSSAGLRATLLIDLIVLFGLVGALVLPEGVLFWPVTVVLGLAAGAILVRLAPSLRPAAPWLVRGRTTREVPWLAAGIVLLSAAALTLWTIVAAPSPPPFVTALADSPLLLVVVGIIGFAAVNAVAEEFLYRGVLQTELTLLCGPVAAVVLQAAAFGLAHLHGFPSGWVGVLLSGSWGLILGVVRLRTGGILAVFVIHIIADTTIGVLGLMLLR